MSFSIIITAGGIGKRMGAKIPKQFIRVADLPILMHSIKCFHSFDATSQIIVTLPEDWINYWEDLITEFQFEIAHTIITGGVERYDSIKNALNHCQYEIIGVHDGVRPLVSHATIERCLQVTKEKGSAIPTLPLKESLRKLTASGSKSVERKNYLSVQTPQFFQAEMLKNAYKIPFHNGITDDASLVEEAGYSITITDGNEENIKVTTPIDLQLVQLFLK